MEKKDPPIITRIINMKDKFFGLSSREIPILETLLVNDSNKWLKSLSILKKMKKKTRINKRYKNRCKSSLKKSKFRFLKKIKL